ncbi:MAG: hypothetical protein LWX07_04345 [Bacteroidetes bacterium]|nr:hypothetical protein [Bacteroidota bacterium]
MEEEVNLDIQNNKLYISPRLNQTGVQFFKQYLIDSIRNGNSETLTNMLQNGSHFNDTELRHTKNGIIDAKIPSNAASVLAEDIFNRFYCRALCVRALSEEKLLKVYRAKSVTNPRPESISKENSFVDPQNLLDDLRNNVDGATEMGVPGGPNSGLSVELI